MITPQFPADSLMGNHSQIRQRIQARIAAGQLPCASIYEVFGRKGDGLSCACCDDVITNQQIEYDVELCSEMGAATTLPMHGFCFHAWYEVASAIRNRHAQHCVRDTNGS